MNGVIRNVVAGRHSAVVGWAWTFNAKDRASSLTDINSGEEDNEHIGVYAHSSCCGLQLRFMYVGESMSSIPLSVDVGVVFLSTECLGLVRLSPPSG